jgi:hypothetical protein
MELISKEEVIQIMCKYIIRRSEREEFIKDLNWLDVTYSDEDDCK